MLILTGNYIFQRTDIAVFGSDAVSTAFKLAQKSFDGIAQRLEKNCIVRTLKIKRILEHSTGAYLINVFSRQSMNLRICNLTMSPTGQATSELYCNCQLLLCTLDHKIRNFCRPASGFV